MTGMIDRGGRVTLRKGQSDLYMIMIAVQCRVLGHLPPYRHLLTSWSTHPPTRP